MREKSRAQTISFYIFAFIAIILVRAILSDESDIMESIGFSIYMIAAYFFIKWLRKPHVYKKKE
ncbi:hypothetical protein [Jeotgalibacillus sp. R-1-5s-1]|uniref:hypothetical protein n=1 Tax=Jeotgalibacillus sp. R-1-5s-1 TaxID=2555897 RepID=UPI00106C1719|nr:hypothetical protein [Jeotgalibacillus sp. R-1-5s-1]TFE00820.1 hypothetical protein E2491_04740 [Jeotgalibacillus sp. R-1-5s-1]